MITFVGVAHQVFLMEEVGWASRSGPNASRAGCKATAIGLGGSIILSGRRIEMKGV